MIYVYMVYLNGNDPIAFTTQEGAVTWVRGQGYVVMPRQTRQPVWHVWNEPTDRFPTHMGRIERAEIYPA